MKGIFEATRHNLKVCVQYTLSGQLNLEFNITWPLKCVVCISQSGVNIESVLRFCISSSSQLHFEWENDIEGRMRIWSNPLPFHQCIWMVVNTKQEEDKNVCKFCTCLVDCVWRNFAHLTVFGSSVAVVYFFIGVSLCFCIFLWSIFVFVFWYGEIPANLAVWSPSSTPALINQQTV